MTTVSSILKFLEMNSQDYSLDQNMDMNSRPRKRRLDHLTWEEKMQRKKLKNRVAAQTSRDRKKAKMEQMETALQQLFSKNESVLAECEALKAANQRLEQENAELLARLQAPCVNCQSVTSNRSVNCEAPVESTEFHLQLKGRTTQLATVLVRIASICLLSKTSWTSWRSTATWTRWNSWPTACCKTSPRIWRAPPKKQINRTGPTSDEWWGKHQNNWNPVGRSPRSDKKKKKNETLT